MDPQDSVSVTSRDEFGFSGNGASLFAAILAPASLGLVLLEQVGMTLQSTDRTAVWWLLPWAVPVVAAGLLIYRQAYEDNVLRAKNEKVILEPPYLIHIGVDGREDFRAKFDEIASIERVVWVQGDSSTRWTVSSGSSSFVLRRRIDRFSELADRLSQVLPAALVRQLR